MRRLIEVWVFTLEEEDPSSHGIVTDLLVKMTRWAGGEGGESSKLALPALLVLVLTVEMHCFHY